MKFGKKIISLMLAMSMALSLIAQCKTVPDTIHAADTSVMYGDVNSDGKINIFDIISLKSYLIEKNSNNFSVRAADVDDDQIISAKDVIELSMFLLGKISAFSSETYIDTDEDGLCDYIEKEILKTDYQVKDTDGDGLDDYTEVYLIGTDPLNTNTGETEVTDSLKDNDKDGLINSEEIKIGTSLINADTDKDGISDYDEVKKYLTDPLRIDTDSDGISDYDEIKLGLEPTKLCSDGKIEDNKRIFDQKINYDSNLLTEINKEPSYQLSVEAAVSGYIDNSVKIIESGYSNTLKYAPICGKVVDINLSHQCTLKEDGLKVIFKLSESDIDKYMIFKYYQNVNMIFPMPTGYDKENNELYCTDDEGGTYCIVDKDKWENIIADISKSKSLPGKTKNTLVLICLDTILANSSFNSTGVIKDISKHIFETNDSESNFLSEELGVFGYSQITQEAQTASTYDTNEGCNFYSYDELEWFFEFFGLSAMTSSFFASSNGSYMVTPMKMALDSSKRENYDNIYVFSLSSEKYEKKDHYTQNEISEICGINGLHGSYIISSSSSDETKAYYQSLAEKFNGKVFLYNGDNAELSSSIGAYIDTITKIYQPEISYFNYNDFFDPSWKESMQNGNANIPDSDGDNLSDAEEINWAVYADNSTYSDYADKKFTGSDKPKEGIDQLLNGASIKTKAFIPFISNPMETDTDGDGLSDGEELIIETDPNNSDTDKDNLEDAIECTAWFDPLDPNPDGDTYNDYEEYQNGTDPFSYNLTAEEWAKQFVDGTVKGDIIKEPTVPQLLGQITGSVVPVVGTVSDVRDTIANASYGHWFMAALSLVGIIPAIGDIAKSSSKVGKFITKNIDKTDEITDLIISISKKFPDDFAKLVPTSSLDEIAEAFKKNNTMSRETYEEIAKIFKKAGKKLYTISDDYPSAKKVIAKENVWMKKDWCERGLYIDDLLGNGADSISGLGRYYPTYDKYDEAKNIATSIKSMDFLRSSYSDEKKFKRALDRYAKSLMNGKNYVELKDGRIFSDIKRELELAVPDVPLTNVQKKILDEFIETNSSKFSVIITIITV